MIVIEGVDPDVVSYEPFAFRSPFLQGQLTDVDADGRRDLDGIEYGQVPDRLLFPRYLGQGDPPNPNPFTEIVLVNLTGTTEFDATVDIISFNDNEEVFSAQHLFRCWTRIALATLSPATRQAFLVGSGHDPNEVFGAPNLESGWLWIDGHSAISPQQSVPDPAILALVVERIPGANAILPFAQGVQANGALIDRGEILSSAEEEPVLFPSGPRRQQP